MQKYYKKKKKKKKNGQTHVYHKILIVAMYIAIAGCHLCYWDQAAVIYSLYIGPAGFCLGRIHNFGGRWGEGRRDKPLSRKV